MTVPQSEDDFIQSIFAPLARGAAGSYGLQDDVAFVPAASKGLIITQDQIIEGTHFLADDPIEMIGRRLVRRNLSDLIAKGALPHAAFLSLAWPQSRERITMAEFARGVGDDLDQLCVGCPLMGGDTSTTSGPLVASMTMLGYPSAPNGQPILRKGAKVGDVLCVVGVIGDAWLGLQARLGLLSSSQYPLCSTFSLAPSPPHSDVAHVIGQYCHAALDVSDGLILDAMRMAIASGIALNLDLGLMPISEEAQAFVRARNEVDALQALASGGDDYQPLVALAAVDFADFERAGQSLGLRVTQIGHCAAGQGVHLSYKGKPIAMPTSTGWQI